MLRAIIVCGTAAVLFPGPAALPGKCRLFSFCFLQVSREDAIRDANGIGAADANDGNGSSWRRGKCANGILFHLGKLKIEE